MCERPAGVGPGLVCPEPECGADNSSLARFCRSCGATLSFQPVFDRELDASVAMTARKVTCKKHETSLDGLGFGGAELSMPYLGYLLVAGERGGVAAFNLLDPVECVFQLAEGRDVDWIHADGTGERRAMLIASGAEMLMAQLLPVASAFKIYESRAANHSSVELGGLLTSGNALCIDSDRASRETTLADFPISAASDGGKLGEPRVTTIEGACSRHAIELPGGEALLFSERACHLYDPRTRDLASYPCPVDLDLSRPPVASGERVFLSAQDNMVVFELRPREFHAFPPELAEPFSFSLTTDRRVLVADQTGFTVYDALSGQEIWDLDKQIGTSFIAGRVPPVPVQGGALVVGALPATGMSLVRIDYAGKADWNLVDGKIAGDPLAPVPWPKGVIVVTNVTARGSDDPVATMLVCELREA